jgi:hypothetical protein
MEYEAAVQLEAEDDSEGTARRAGERSRATRGSFKD